MGWKAFKARFGIKHIVSVDGDEVCIGSPLVHRIVGFNIKTGVSIEDHASKGFLSQAYPQLLEVEPKEIVDLFNQPDEFEKSIPVFTFDSLNGVVVETLCEELGWPNVTHDGQLMYSNHFFATKEEAMEALMEGVQYKEKSLSREVAAKQKALVQLQGKLDATRAIMAAHGWKSLPPEEWE